MSMSFKQLFLSLSSRLPRRTFTPAFLFLSLSFFVLFVFVDSLFGRDWTLILYPFAAWGAFTLTTQRLHDHGLSMLWLLLVLVPLLGPLWAFYILFCRAGTAGENQYGDDILARGADYLTVAHAEPANDRQ